MKKLLVSTVLVAGLAATVYGQGIIISDTANSQSGLSSATSGGVVWTNVNGNIGLFDGVDYNLGVTVLAGASSSSLSLLGTYVPSGPNYSDRTWGGSASVQSLVGMGF